MVMVPNDLASPLAAYVGKFPCFDISTAAIHASSVESKVELALKRGDR